VLESHGWTIHRIWSTDWFQRPKEQIDLVIARIEAAKAEHDSQAAGVEATRAVNVEITTLEREGFRPPYIGGEGSVRAVWIDSDGLWGSCAICEPVKPNDPKNAFMLELRFYLLGN